MGNAESNLSQFRKAKLVHEFVTFYDFDKDGHLEWKDFDRARQHVCKISGWKVSDQRFLDTQKLFIKIWDSLKLVADSDFDGKITVEEWVRMWEKYNENQFKEDETARKEKRKPVNLMPEWLDNYVDYKFQLYDRTGDGEIDVEEFIFVLDQFHIKKNDAKAAFTMFSEGMPENTISKDRFKELCTQYYMSDDPNDVGNFITGKLDFPHDEDDTKKK